MDVVVQAINSLRYVPERGPRIRSIQAAAAAHPGNEIITASAQQSLQFDPAQPSGIRVKIDPVGMALMQKGQRAFSTDLFRLPRRGWQRRGHFRRDAPRAAARRFAARARQP